MIHFLIFYISDSYMTDALHTLLHYHQVIPGLIWAVSFQLHPRQDLGILCQTWNQTPGLYLTGIDSAAETTQQTKFG